MHPQDEEHREYFEYMQQQSRDCTSLLENIAKTQGQGKSWREEVIEHCRTYSEWERTMWYYLSSYVENRTFRLNDRPDALFQLRDEDLREQILSLIPQIPKTALSDFKQLLSFVGSFLDRMTYLCDWLLNSFLSKANEQNPMPCCEGRADRLAMKPDEELLGLCESIVINTIQVIDCSYSRCLEDDVWEDEPQ